MTTERKRIGRPPGATKEETIARIVSSAQRHFGERGFAGARLTEIAKDAGVTHSSIYLYFDAKPALYAEAFRAAQEVLLPAYLAALEGAPDLRSQVASLFRASVVVDQSTPVLTPFLASVPIELRRHPELGDVLAGEGQPLLDAVTGMLESATARGELAGDVDPFDLLTAFLGSAMGIGLLSYGLGGGRMAAAVDIVLAALDGGFFSPRHDDPAPDPNA